ncbi:MAG: phage major capsid protein [Methanobrevibacter sp.]|nr:phage major capsid protein [Methanobrevibacter sp.]
MNSLEILDNKNILVKRNLDILALAKKEERELTEDENKEFDENEQKIKELDEEAEKLEKELEETEKEKEELEEQNKNIDKDNMEKKEFSLIKEIRSAAETGKSINMRTSNYSVAANGEDVVETDILDIMTPLRANLVLTKAGAKFMSGLVGDVQVPLMSATNVAWAAEEGAASDGSGSFSNVTLSPKRLTAYVPITLQMLAQDSLDVEAKIREDIIKAVQDKLEATILGYAAGTTTQPAGVFYNHALTSVTTYGDLCDFEASVEENNVYGSMHYIVTPKAKAYLRSLIKGTAAVGMVYENREIDGIPTEVTTNLVCANANKDGVLYGDFSNLAIGAWDNIQLDVVRDSASLKNGCVTLIINAFFDAKVLRPEAFAYGKIVKPEE